jgi:Zn-dependent protease
MGFDIEWTLKVVPAAIIGLTIHEFSHAFVAFKLGDMTAKNDGRLTLDPRSPGGGLDGICGKWYKYIKSR